MNSQSLEAGLAQFTGTENYTRHALMRDLLMTDGVVFLADNAGAHWLTDIVGSHLMTNKTLRGEEFQCWTLEKTGTAARVFATDGNDTTIVSQDIEYTDFPLAEIKLFCNKATEFGPKAWVLMLPSEY